MRTDKQIHQIFAANPEWIFELTGLPSPGPCQFRSVSLKAIEQRADGVIFPESADQPLTVVEIQFQRDEGIYLRMVLEMALMQQQAPGRIVQGVILFLELGLAPRSLPWCQIIGSYSIVDLIAALARRIPDHPLVAVFYPVLAESTELLEKEAAGCYHLIKTSGLTAPLRSVLLDVFVSWLEQRFKNKGKQEIEEMLMGQLTDLRETQSGKDLIAIGIQEGIKEGIKEGIEVGELSAMRKAVALTLKSRFGELSQQLIDRLAEIRSVERLEQLQMLALEIRSIEQFRF